MRKFLKENAKNASVFSLVFYIFSMFLTLDVYCKDQVTPETPLYNIAGLLFLRMEFVLIVFALAFAAGVLLAVLLKKLGRFLFPFSLGCLGIISVFMFAFDVNTMQILSPTMRISHVIMTVSRVLAIVAGASGIFAGVCTAFVSASGVSKKQLPLRQYARFWAAFSPMLKPFRLCFICSVRQCSLQARCLLIFSLPKKS